MFNYTYFQFFTLSSTALSPLADNVPAAWRSGGFHKCLCGVQNFNYARHFPRGYCRRCAKPQVVRWHFFLILEIMT
jgi:hypothetical protein